MLRKLLLLLFICIASLAWSQPPTQEQLEARKAKIQEEIFEKEQQKSLKNYF
jgi:F0F1-type ATP synthase membrane subunit b/b'